MDYQSPRGTQDILPEEQPYWRFVQDKAAFVAERYGYQRIDTPTFEDSRLFIRTVGEETDIVSKEMYTFADRGGSELTLRPEGTAPVCRAYLEHGMGSRPKPVKLYYLASIFRYDRPQAGRYREHHQFGFEVIGEADAAADAEVIDMAWRFYSGTGFDHRAGAAQFHRLPGVPPAYIVGPQGLLRERHRHPVLGLPGPLCQKPAAVAGL